VNRGETMDQADGARIDTFSRRRRLLVVAVNVLLALAIVGLLLATWMPAIYDRLATTRPPP
jgi:hypothetical protein